MIPQATVAYLHHHMPTGKFSTQLGILSEQNASSLAVLIALQFKLVKKMIHATKKKKKRKLSHSFLEGKCHFVLYLAVNLYANVCLHHHIKGLHISTAAASQRKMAKRKVSALRHL